MMLGSFRLTSVLSAMLFVITPAVLDAQSSAQSRYLTIDTKTLQSALKALSPVRIRVQDPLYKIAKEYEAYPFSAVLTAVVADLAFYRAHSANIAFVCHDGYAPAISLSRALSQNAYLATKDVTAKGNAKWEPFLHGKDWITPEPFYLVWTNIKESDEGYPWPYQLERLELSVPENKQPSETGTGETQIARGQAIFQAKCVGCHSINLMGGSVGPELNVPRNVTEYWPARDLAAFILDASSYHAHSKMPSFSKSLSNEEVDEIVIYLESMRLKKKCDTTSACEQISYQPL